MKTLKHTCWILVAAGLTQGVSLSSPLSVSVTGLFSPSVIGSAWLYASNPFLLNFTVDQSPSNVTAQSGGGAFSVPVTFTYGSGQTYTGTAGWFQYPGGPTGVDLRFGAPDGSFLQTIVTLTPLIYTGTDSKPTILPMLTTPIQVATYFYTCGSCASQTQQVQVLSNPTFVEQLASSSVPEPSSVMLMCVSVVIGLCLHGRRSRESS